MSSHRRWVILQIRFSAWFSDLPAWDARREVEGYSGAVHKSFATSQEARHWVEVTIANLNFDGRP